MLRFRVCTLVLFIVKLVHERRGLHFSAFLAHKIAIVSHFRGKASSVYIYMCMGYSSEREYYLEYFFQALLNYLECTYMYVPSFLIVCYAS